MVAAGARSVPFTLKAPKRITHVNRLRESESHVAEFLRRASSLGSKLGVLLFQLPPYLKKDLPRLPAFLDQLPPGKQIAFEFRSTSWQDDEVYELLRRRGAILCVTDTDEGDTPFVATSDCGYVACGAPTTADDDLRAWAAQIAARALPRTYVLFHA